MATKFLLTFLTTLAFAMLMTWGTKGREDLVREYNAYTSMGMISLIGIFVSIVWIVWS